MDDYKVCPFQFVRQILLPSLKCSPNIIWFHKKTILYLEIVFILNRTYNYLKSDLSELIQKQFSFSLLVSFGQGILFPASFT